MPKLTHVHIEGLTGSSVSSLVIDEKTAIIGNNGSGKTHILESIHLGAGGEIPYKMERGEEPFSIALSYENESLEYAYRFRRENNRREYYVQGKKVSSVKYMEHLPFGTVLFSPFDMNLLFFAPTYRREMMDALLRRTFAQFPKVKRDYDEALRQRNALLKQVREGVSVPTDLVFWDTELSRIAEVYMMYRERWVAYIEGHMRTLDQFLPGYEISFIYETKCDRIDVKESILDYLTRNRDRDTIIGHTTIGPHIDDFSFQINHGNHPHNASLFLSRGENKILLLFLKYMEIHFLEEITGKSTLLLFDDLFAELDEGHMTDMFRRFQEYQIIFTTQRLPDMLKKTTDFTCINLSLP